MNKTTEPISYKSLQLKEGQDVRLIEPVENGPFVFKPLYIGKIVALSNQTKASIWIKRRPSVYDEKLMESLNVDKSSAVDGQFEGGVFDISAKNFAVQYERTEEFDTLTIDERKTLNIPYFKEDKEKLYPSRLSMRNDKGEMEPVGYYLLIDLIERVDEAFEEWVSAHCTFHEVTEEEKENGDYPSHMSLFLDKESFDRYYSERYDLELAFARATGVAVTFLGGLSGD